MDNSGPFVTVNLLNLSVGIEVNLGITLSIIYLFNAQILSHSIKFEFFEGP